ncbi:LPS translocon maturation chaperone LptM [Hylemonella gracilis]|nr:lipoprotein [Hylemonella gracilis]
MLKARSIVRATVRSLPILVSPPASSPRRVFAPVALAVIGLSGSLLLAGCGQTGVLYLPTEPAAAQRASLPKSLWPLMPSKKKDEAQPEADPKPGASTPAPTPANTLPPQPQP